MYKFSPLIVLLVLQTTVSAQQSAYDPSAVFEQSASIPAPDNALPGQPRGTVGSELLNGGFELNGGDGSTVINDWTVVSVLGSVTGTPGAGNFVAYNSTVSPIGGQPLELPTEGAFGAVSDTTGPSGHILFQDITIPAEGADIVCDIFFNNQSGANIDAGILDFESVPNQHARIDIMDPAAPVDDTGAGVLANLFITGDTDPASFSFVEFEADVSAFAGQTVRLRFAEVNNQFFQNFAVDNCALIASLPPPEVPTLGLLGLSLTAALLMIIGLVLIKRRHT